MRTCPNPECRQAFGPGRGEKGKRAITEKYQASHLKNRKEYTVTYHRCPHCLTYVHYRSTEETILLADKNTVWQCVLKLAWKVGQRTGVVDPFLGSSWGEEFRHAYDLLERSKAYVAANKIPVTPYRFCYLLVEEILNDRFWHDKIVTFRQVIKGEKVREFATRVMQKLMTIWQDYRVNQRRQASLTDLGVSYGALG